MKKGLSNKTWLGILGGVMVLCAAAAALVFLGTPKGAVAVVTLDGEEVHRVDLAAVTEGYELSFTGKSGITDVVEVSPGKIRVRQADCPDQVCVKQGWIGTGVAPIVCLPNRLVIEIADGVGEVDGVTK